MGVGNQSLLVIGDTHLSDRYPGYLDAQIKFLNELIYKFIPSKAGAVLFLGDVFDSRSPKPNILLAFQRFLKQVPCHVGILRGNHDSQTKADDGVTSLSLFSDTHVKVFKEYEAFNNLHFIPHYESDSVITDILTNNTDTSSIVFGHFGYSGCMGAMADYEFTIPLDTIRGTAILGHIHYYKKEGNVTILGTPYSVDFTEAGKSSYVAVLDSKDKIVNIDIHSTEDLPQPRYLVSTYEELHLHKLFLQESKDYVILRVLIDPLSEANSPEIIRSIINEYKVKWVEIKFKSFINDKVKEDLSSFRPKREIVTINDQVLEDYVEANNAGLTKEDLMNGLKDIRNA